MATQVACSWGGNVRAVGSKTIPTSSFRGQKYVPLFHTGNWQFKVYYDDANGVQIQTTDVKTGVTENMGAAGPSNGSPSYLNLVNSGGYGVTVICQLNGQVQTANIGAAAGSMEKVMQLNANLMQQLKACDADLGRSTTLTKQCIDNVKKYN